MNDLERFLAIVNFQEPDYYPVFGMRGAPGFSAGCQRPAHDRLRVGGMPEWVGGTYKDGAFVGVETWEKYWGTTGAIYVDFWPARNFPEPLKYKRLIEGGFEFVECETGARTKQVLDNDNTYSMPEFQAYDVRDRASWEYYKGRTECTGVWTQAEIDEACKQFDNRDKPLCVNVAGTYGVVRSLMGTELASVMLYDDPELVHDIIDTFDRRNRTFLFPLIERLKPEIIATGEDICYNHGLLLSPAHFREFCSPLYKAAAECAIASGVKMRACDCDGNVMQFVELLDECGFNALFPFEVKAGNDLMQVREKLPSFIMFGGLEKEVVNEGNEGMIEPEIMTKVPPLLHKGGYFPNQDHGIQPYITFGNLCKFMTILHELCGNPEGMYPKTR